MQKSSTNLSSIIKSKIKIQDYDVISSDDIISIDERINKVQYIDTFYNLCKIFKMNVYLVKQKQKDIHKMWKSLHKEMRDANIKIYELADLLEYLQTSYIENIDSAYGTSYKIILDYLNSYKAKRLEFESDRKHFIYRLRNYAKARKCFTMDQLIMELDIYLNNFNPNNPENTIERENWVVMCRYICDFIMEEESIENELGIPYIHPIFPISEVTK